MSCAVYSGVASVEGVGDTWADTDGASVAVGDCDGSAIAVARGDDIGDVRDVMAR